jgi:hypothetical protein
MWIISKDDVTKEFHFGVEFDFLKFVQNKTYISFIVFHDLRKNGNVINVTNHKIIQIFTKNA